jgi:hypothetical protein
VPSDFSQCQWSVSVSVSVEAGGRIQNSEYGPPNSDPGTLNPKTPNSDTPPLNPKLGTPNPSDLPQRALQVWLDSLPNRSYRNFFAQFPAYGGHLDIRNAAGSDVLESVKIA